MNKAALIDALAERLGDKRVAAAAVAGLVEVVIRTVNAGDKVAITGFGVFEKRARAARTARNPRTGEAVPVQQTDVPVFRPGTLFREVVSGTRELPAADVSTAASPLAAAPSHPVTTPAPTGPSTASVTSRSATRVTAATRLTSVHVAATKAAAKAAKAASKTAKAGKAEPKATTKGATKASSRGTVKKAGKKSATKK